MDSDILALFQRHYTIGDQIFVALSLILIAGTILMMVPRIARTILPKPQEDRLCDFIPFESLLPDRQTIRCKDGSLSRVYKIGGLDIGFLPEGEREAHMMARKQFFDETAQIGATIKVFALSRPVRSPDPGEFQHSMLRQIAEAWHKSFANAYVKKSYILISVSASGNALEKLDHAAQMLTATLALYSPILLAQAEGEEIGETEESPLHVLAGLISPISQPRPKWRSGQNLAEILCADIVEFGEEDGLTIFTSGERRKYCAVIGIKRLGDKTDEAMTIELAALPCESTILHNVEPIGRGKAILQLTNDRRISVAAALSTNPAEQFQDAIDMVEAQGLGDGQNIANYAMSIFLFSHSLEGIARAEEEVRRICAAYGVTPVREGAVAQATWFSQFPTYTKWPRPFRFFTENVAMAVTLDRSAEGRDRSDWGAGPIALFRTAQGTTYKFQFHVPGGTEEVGHAAVIGPTGTGKTTLLTFLAGMALRHPDVRVFMFDRFRGMEVMTRALGGAYIRFDGDVADTRLNPFKMKDTSENRRFLKLWMRGILQPGSDVIAEHELMTAVDTIYDVLPDEMRSLKKTHEALFAVNSRNRREIQRWVSDNAYGHMFNAETDTLDLSSRLVGFDMTRVLADERLAPAVVSYLIRRIQDLTFDAGMPALIIADETEPMLRDENFKEEFLRGLQEGRKKRHAWICAFQRPQAIETCNVSDAIRGQCQSLFFLRNRQAKPEDYAKWDLTEREFAFVKGRSHNNLPYAVLLKRHPTSAPAESIILDTNLSPLGPLLKLYASGSRSVLLAEKLHRQYGPDFVPHYLNAA